MRSPVASDRGRSGPSASPAMIAASPCPAATESADRRRVLNAPLGPQRIEAARDLERGPRADIAVEHVAVISHQLDDAQGPILGEPETLTEIIFDAEQTPDLGIVRLHLLVDIRLVDVE